MGGFLGIGHSSEKTDRATQLSAQQGDWGVFNQGMAIGQAGQAAGTQTLNQAKRDLGPAESYYKNLLTAGRTQTAQRAAPALQAVQDQTDAARRQEAATGTGRAGGTAAANREAGTTEQSQIDQIINTTLQSGRAEGAKGLTQTAGAETAIGTEQLGNAMRALGLSEDAVTNIMNNATDSRYLSNQINLQTQEQWGQLAGMLMMGSGMVP